MFFRGLLSVHSRYGLHARGVAKATLYTESSDSFVASAAASIATGWSEPVPGRELHPLKSSAFHGALFQQQDPELASGSHQRFGSKQSEAAALFGKHPIVLPLREDSASCKVADVGQGA